MSNFVYLVTSSSFNGVKIGKTKDWLGLKSRYRTPYGDDMIMYVFECNNMHRDEKHLHTYFSQYRLNSELFDKQYQHLYVDYCVDTYKMIYPLSSDIVDNKVQRDVINDMVTILTSFVNKVDTNEQNKFKEFSKIISFVDILNDCCKFKNIKIDIKTDMAPLNNQNDLIIDGHLNRYKRFIYDNMDKYKDDISKDDFINPLCDLSDELMRERPYKKLPKDFFVKKFIRERLTITGNYSDTIIGKDLLEEFRIFIKHDGKISDKPIYKLFNLLGIQSEDKPVKKFFGIKFKIY